MTPKKAGKHAAAIDRLPAKQALFAREFLVDLNGTQAAIRAGFSARSAAVTASRMLKNAKVVEALSELQQARIERLDLKGDELVQFWRSVLEANPNSLMQFKVSACRHCWGIDFAYQCTPAEFPQKRAEWKIKRQNLLERANDAEGGEADIGDFNSHEGDWYDSRRDPNQDCPECFGDGVGEVFLKDTRLLTGPELALYAGARKTKDGTEILTHSKERAGELLGRSLGIFNPENMQSSTPKESVELALSFAEVMQAARDRQDAIYKERGITRTDTGNPA